MVANRTASIVCSESETVTAAMVWILSRVAFAECAGSPGVGFTAFLFGIAWALSGVGSKGVARAAIFGVFARAFQWVCFPCLTWAAIVIRVTCAVVVEFPSLAWAAILTIVAIALLVGCPNIIFAAEIM